MISGHHKYDYYRNRATGAFQNSLQCCQSHLHSVHAILTKEINDLVMEVQPSHPLFRPIYLNKLPDKNYIFLSNLKTVKINCRLQSDSRRKNTIFVAARLSTSEALKVLMIIINTYIRLYQRYQNELQLAFVYLATEFSGMGCKIYFFRGA